MRIVVALGGNALRRRGERPDAAVQQVNAVRAVTALAALARDNELVITHGNGPRMARRPSEVPPIPPWPCPARWTF